MARAFGVAVNLDLFFGGLAVMDPDQMTSVAGLQVHAAVELAAVAAGLLCEQGIADASESPAVWVGFSGGADSTALLLALRSLAQAAGWQAGRLTAVHLHHGMRPDAEADADLVWCEAFAARLGVAFRSARLEVPAHVAGAEGLEAGARRLRLAWWRANLPAGGMVALGHHQDDALETMLLNLLRGANASGLATLRPWRVVEGVPLWRPLLELRRETLEEFLRDMGVTDWRVDASNVSPAYRRNRVRHELLPLCRDLAGHERGLQQSLAALAMDAAALEAMADEVYAAAVVSTVAGPASEPRWLGPGLPVAMLAGVSAALLPRLVRRLVSASGGPDVPPRSTALALLPSLLLTEPPALIDEDGADEFDGLDMDLGAAAGGAFGVELGAGWRLWRFGDRVYAGPTRMPRLETPCAWNWRATPALTLRAPDGGVVATVEARVAPAKSVMPGVEALGKWGTVFPLGDVPETLRWRSREPGDRLAPFGERGQRRLKKLVGASALHALDRQRVLVLVDGVDRLLWVPGVRRSSHLPVSATDQEVLVLQFRFHGLGCDEASEARPEAP